jgi:hypothetical protein
VYKVLERGSMDGGDYDIWNFLRAAYCCVSLHLPVACINQPEVLFAGEGYHMGITTNIYVK